MLSKLFSLELQFSTECFQSRLRALKVRLYTNWSETTLRFVARRLVFATTAVLLWELLVQALLLANKYNVMLANACIFFQERN